MQFLKGNFAFISPSEISANHYPSAKIADTLTLTSFKAVTQQLANVSALGSKIYPENRGNSLNIELSKPTTNQMWKNFAEEVYNQTGLDLQPEIYQYTFNSYARMLGTIGEMAIHAIENPNRELLGRKIPPVLNSFYGPKGENSHQEKAEKLQQEIVYRYRRIMGLYTVRK